MAGNESRFALYVSRGLGRSSLALLLGLGLFLLLSGWLAQGATNRVLEPVASPPRSTEGKTALPPRLRGGLRGGDSTLLPDPRVAALMTQITTGTVAAHERALTGLEPVIVGGQPYTLTTRNSYSGEPISQATRYVYEHLQSLGLDVAFHAYVYGVGHRRDLVDQWHWRNVVAERRGLRWPDRVYLITAHLDDMPPPSQSPVAPGADDNASGSTAVLIAAELLSRYEWDCTLRFVLFTGEEQGLHGSAAYAADLATAGEDVRGVLNLDMIGYNSDAAPIVDLHARSAIPGSIAVAETFSRVVALYGLDLAPDILVDDWLGNYSDNKSFWDQGYAAILAIEDEDDFNPDYHTPNDRLDRLDLDYFAEFVRAAVGTLAHVGCLASTGWVSGTVTDVDSGAPLSATVSALAPGRIYTATAGAGGHYSLTLPAYAFTLQARAHQMYYGPATVTDVAILTNATTVQHFALKFWPHWLFLPALLKQG